MKAQHGKTLSPISKMKSGRTIRPKVVKAEKPVAPLAKVVPLSGVKKYSEDDFIVDYHYGDSVSNDEEVAKISEKRRKMSVNVELTTTASSTSASSYYPSTNSEFSTPETPQDLPKFDTKPPPGVSGVSMTVKKVSEPLTPRPPHAQASTNVLVTSKPTEVINDASAYRAGSGHHRDRIVTTKPAFLAQINGEQVLLIHGPADSSDRVHDKVSNNFVHSTSTTTPSFKPPIPGQSKLEQCLRYGSAAVSKKNVPAAIQISGQAGVKKSPPFVVKLQPPKVLAPKRKTKTQFTSPAASAPKFFVINSDQTLEPQIVLSKPQQLLSQQQQPTLSIPNPVKAPQQFIIAPQKFALPSLQDNNVVLHQSLFATPQQQQQQPTVTSTNRHAGFDEIFVPEMICEEEVVSCDDFAAEISVRIESSRSSPSQREAADNEPPQFYNPKWSPAAGKQNRDQILCDLLGIDK